MTKEMFEIEYKDGSSLIIEGFGPETILGALRDLLNGDENYKDEERVIAKITIYPAQPE